MTRLEALERVAEAARQSLKRWDQMAATRVLETAIAALDAIDALPPQPQQEGEWVEKRLEIWASPYGPRFVKFADNRFMPGSHYRHIATIIAPVPLPRVPEVRGEVIAAAKKEDRT